MPHPTWGEEVAAAVVLRDAATEADLLAYCQERFADYKRPKQIHFAEADPPHRDREDSTRHRGAIVSQIGIVRIVIVGAGAIGGYIGARLARAGADVVCSPAARICGRCRSAACASSARTAISRCSPPCPAISPRLARPTSSSSA